MVQVFVTVFLLSTGWQTSESQLHNPQMCAEAVASFQIASDVKVGFAYCKKAELPPP